MKKISLLLLPFLLLGTLVQAQFKTPDLSRRNQGPAHRLENMTMRPVNGLPLNGSLPFAGLEPNYRSLTTLPPFSALAQRLKVQYDPQTGQAILVEGRIEGAEGSTEREVFTYLHAAAGILNIQDPDAEFRIVQTDRSDYGETHIRLSQRFRGLPVYNGELVLHADAGGIHLLTGRVYPTPSLEQTAPGLSVSQARDIALDHVRQFTRVSVMDRQLAELTGGTVPHAELVIYHMPGKLKDARLAWWLTIVPNISARWQYLIDARTGEVLDQFKDICSFAPHGHGDAHPAATAPGVTTFLPPNGPKTAVAKDLNGTDRTINTYELDGAFLLYDASRPMYNAQQSQVPQDPVGAIVTLDARNTSPAGDNFTAYFISTPNNVWNDRTAVSAHYHGGVAYEYYRTTFNRNSIDGNGGSIFSVINVVEDDGSAMDNAFWNGQAMFYGNGNQAFTALPKGLDVAGHEMTHGVIQHSANLEYRNESGAINESFADVFGVMIDRDDWTIGEDIVNTIFFPSGAMRDMANPNNGGSGLNDNGWQPAHVSEKYNGTEDNGGVHINSGIPNRAFYLFATQVGKNVAEKVYYEALTKYLTRSSQFIDLRNAVIQAATALHGANSSQVTAAANAFTQVGIGAGQSTDPYDDFDANPGKDYIIFSDADYTRLDLLDVQGSTFIGNPFLDLGAGSRPSVTDDGSIIVFVDTQKRAVGIFIDWQTGEASAEFLSEDPIWRNVAISRDGKLLAALTDDYDNRMYVFNLLNGQSREFALFNPTTAQGGLETNDVAYADAFEWDFSGQYIMYDALNQINTISGPIQFWDIGFINVWNNGTNGFGDNYIEKLFSSLPDNISVGNPTFSKNSPYIIAFDALDESTEEYAVLAANIENGDVGGMADNTTLGFPNYSVTDEFLIFDGEDFFGERVIKAVQVDADKINAASNPVTYLSGGPGARWGVWFGTGDRDLSVGTGDPEQDPSSLSVYPNPFSEGLTLDMELPGATGIQAEVLDLMGRTVYRQSLSAHAGANRLQLDLPQLPAGTYVLRLHAAGWTMSRKVVRK